MTIDKALTVDLNRVQPHKVIKIHEGDVNSVFIVLTVTNLGASVSLTGLTIKYDAVINDYLAEQDASGTVDTTNNTIRIPVTSNMTAMSGTLRVDVRMIHNTEVLYTQTITMLVERSVVQGSTYIDFSHTSIVQRMNSIEASFATLHGVTVIDDETSTGWGDDIPTTYVGELGDLAFYNGDLFYLYGISTHESNTYYNWGRLVDDADIDDFEERTNKVSSISSENKSSTTNYPSNKAITDYVDGAASGKESTSNKVTSLSSSSTDTQYPSAKCVYDLVGDVETLLSQV